jgi:hypothetical protein
LQFPLDIFQSTNVFPRHIRNFNNLYLKYILSNYRQTGEYIIKKIKFIPRATYSFTKSRRVAGRKSSLEMIIGNSHGVQYLSIYGLILQIYDIHLLTNALKSSFSAKGSKVRTNISMGVFGNVLQLNLR